MSIPVFRKGQTLRAQDLQQLADAVRANRLLPGAGIRITGSPNGTTVAVDQQRLVPISGPALHQVDFAGRLPNPFTIMEQLTGELTGLFFAALPGPDAVANQAASTISTPLLAALPSVTEIAQAVASVVSGAITGAGGGGEGGVDALFEDLSEAAPEASAIGQEILPLFDAAFGVLDQVNEFVDAKFQQYANVGDQITAHFAAAGVRLPRSGDYIYTEECGILYVVFPVDQQTGIPTTNLIFRVHFMTGQAPPEGQPDLRRWWCAMSTFPAPDVAAICRMVANVLRQLLMQIIGMTCASAGAASQSAAAVVAGAAGHLGDGTAQGVGQGIAGALEETSLIASNGHEVTTRLIGPVYGASLVATAQVISRSGDELLVGVFWQSPGGPLLSYPSLVGADGLAHTVGVLGDIPQAFTPSQHIRYMGSDGQVWQTPALFASTAQGITGRGRFKFIGCDGQGWSMEVPYYLGTGLTEDINSDTLDLVDDEGTIQTVHTIGTTTASTGVLKDIFYLSTGGDSMTIQVFSPDAAIATDAIVTKEEIDVCGPGGTETKTFLTAPQTAGA